MKNPKLLWARIWVIFDVICFLLALYMTLKNIGRFQEDLNATAITYKKYGHTFDDKYPSFSVCFEGNELYSFNESAIFTSYGIYLSDYEMMLNGKEAFQYKYNPLTRRYSKNPLSTKFKPNVRFNKHDLFQLPNIVKKTSFVVENAIKSISSMEKDEISSEHAAEKLPMYISYQTLKLFCLTRRQGHSSDFTRRYDALTLDMSAFNSNTKLKIFIHYPGHMLRSFDTPRIEAHVNRFLGGGVNLRISQTSLLRKRSVPNEPCNKNMYDHDLFLLQTISNDTGCIPPYWKNIISTISSLNVCSSPAELKKAHDLTTDYRQVIKDRDNPCLNMLSSVVWHQGTYENSKVCEKCTQFKIVYLEKYYEEIKQVKHFGFEDFVSGLGGFIGIFLGYSMMQIPQLLGKISTYKLVLDLNNHQKIYDTLIDILSF